MKRFILPALLGLAFFLSVSPARLSAATIAVEDWWLQTDTLGGLRQSTTDGRFYFAVSQSNVWSPGDTYEAPTGYRVATTAEGEAVFNQGNSSYVYTYYSQGGWSGYYWEGKSRALFRFSDSHLTGAYKHAGNFDEYYVQTSPSTTDFAGLVLIADMAAVPLPASGVLLMLGLGGFGLMRRRKTN
ncbi:VPLPA-CTERM sorting domain-containing protein [Primorskyibacter sp. 2E107]|uniref:VPLPA-CTERM sorting domain-containing protein n=1 Tax=Primorskyibacter sp. 2E107 TaxID=3403458 RepID=UPI003AF686E2